MQVLRESDAQVASAVTPFGTAALDTPIGAGATATVYRADLGQIPMAIKVLHAELALDEEALERFAREVRLVDELAHPCVPAFYSHGFTSDGRPFATFGFVRGRTLRERIREDGRLDLTTALGTLDDLLDVLILAHQKSVVHRDIKPGNIIISPDGLPYLLDFGLARLLDGAPLSRQGVLGTPAYMAPEQARGEPATAQTDLFGVALSIAAAMAGRPLRTGSSLQQLLEHALLPFPKLGSLHLGIPHEVCAVLDRALAFHPADRYPSAEEMQRALRHAGRALGVALPLRRESGPMRGEICSDTTVLSPVPASDSEAAPRPAIERPSASGVLSLDLAEFAEFPPRDALDLDGFVELPPPPIGPHAAAAVGRPPPPGRPAGRLRSRALLVLVTSVLAVSAAVWVLLHK